MTGYEYKVIPAPAKGRKARGVKGPEARFAHALELQMNELAAEGWEYLRADILPSEERQGLTSTQTVYRSVLVFRREALGEDDLEDLIEDTEESVDDDTFEDEETETSDAEDAETDETPDADTDPNASDQEKDATEKA